SQAPQRAAEVPPTSEPVELVPFESTRPASFPLDALPEGLSLWAEAVAEETQVPVDMPAMCAIGVIATVVQRKINIRASEGHVESLSAWTIAVMESGNRKSPVFRRALGPLVAYEQQIALEMQDEIAKSQAMYEALKQELDNVKRDKQIDMETRAAKMTELKIELAKHKIIRAPRYLTDDCTPEKLAQLLSWHSESLSIASSESDVFSIILGRYSKGLNVELYLKAFSGDRHSVDRKSAKSIDLQAPALSMVLTAQPSVIIDLKKIPQIEDRGLLARFWFTIPQSFVGRRQINSAVVPSDVEADYSNTITSLLNIKQQVDEYDNIDPYTISLSPEAKSVYLEYAHKIEPQLTAGSGELAELPAWGNKLVDSMVRLMGILHLYEYAMTPQPWAEPVSEEMALKAVALGDYLKSHAMRAYEVMRTDSVVNDAQYVWRRILDMGDTFTQRELYQMVKKRIQKVVELEPILSLLTESGYIVELPHEPREGRPSRVFQVNIKAKKQEIKDLESYPQYPQNPLKPISGHKKHEAVNSFGGNGGKIQHSEKHVSDEDAVDNALT
ncbi:MAG: YfjI family protein, partial [Nitrosopumilus sp.]